MDLFWPIIRTRITHKKSVHLYSSSLALKKSILESDNIAMMEIAFVLVTPKIRSSVSKYVEDRKKLDSLFLIMQLLHLSYNEIIFWQNSWLKHEILQMLQYSHKRMNQNTLEFYSILSTKQDLVSYHNLINKKLILEFLCPVQHMSF